ncbi:hypothetical protein NDU88_003019 [Pleurodeles waltl]|uniref:Uncharacterized protein n=1 Tax=Pleurodeles waltl TaxID=8319 RepID=A0AAV7PBQ8_PLEWA|nr:hypothetical protein NDU88_003019 [Pleurodeles waltl]
MAHPSSARAAPSHILRVQGGILVTLSTPTLDPVNGVGRHNRLRGCLVPAPKRRRPCTAEILPQSSDGRPDFNTHRGAANYDSVPYDGKLIGLRWLAW